jgi:hypothetical protein
MKLPSNIYSIHGTDRQAKLFCPIFAEIAGIQNILLPGKLLRDSIKAAQAVRKI